MFFGHYHQVRWKLTQAGVQLLLANWIFKPSTTLRNRWTVPLYLNYSSSSTWFFFSNCQLSQPILTNRFFSSRVTTYSRALRFPMYRTLLSLYPLAWCSMAPCTLSSKANGVNGVNRLNNRVYLIDGQVAGKTRPECISSIWRFGLFRAQVNIKRHKRYLCLPLPERMPVRHRFSEIWHSPFHLGTGMEP